MPTEITELSSRKGRSATYDWDLFLDGTARNYTQGQKDADGEVTVEGDFYCQPTSFESQARKVAGERDLRLEARVFADRVELQAFPKSDEDEVDTIEAINEQAEDDSPVLTEA